MPQPRGGRAAPVGGSTQEKKTQVQGLAECAKNFRRISGDSEGAARICKGPAEASVFAAAYQRIVEQRQLLREQEAAYRELQRDSLARLGILTQHNITDTPVTTEAVRPPEETEPAAQHITTRKAAAQKGSVEFRTMLPLLRSYRKSCVFVPSPHLCKLWGLPDPWANVAVSFGWEKQLADSHRCSFSC